MCNPCLLDKHGKLDLARVREWLKKLGELKEDPGLADRFEDLLRKSL